MTDLLVVITTYPTDQGIRGTLTLTNKSSGECLEVDLTLGVKLRHTGGIKACGKILSAVPDPAGDQALEDWKQSIFNLLRSG